MALMFAPWRSDSGDDGTRLTLAEVLLTLLDGPMPFRFTAYDGSEAGPPTRGSRLHLRTPRGTAYLATAPGSLGMARAYVAGDLELAGVHPGDPYELLRLMAQALHWRRPDARTLARVARSLGPAQLVPPTAAAAGGAARLAPRAGGAAALQAPRRRGDPAPLRRLEPVLRDGPRAVDDVHLRRLPDGRGHARAGAGREVRPGVPQARPAAGQRLLDVGCGWGEHGAARGPQRRPRPRRDAVPGAGRVGAGRDQGRGAGPPRRGAPPRLPRRRRERFRRGQLDRPHRAHRRRELPGLLRLPLPQAAPGRPAAQPLHHPAGQHPRAAGARRLHRPVRLPGRRADRLGQDHHGHAEHRLRGAPRGEPPRALREDLRGLVRQPRGALGRVRRRGRRGDGEGVGPVPGRVAARLRAQPGAAAPGARRQAARRTARRTSRCGRTGARCDSRARAGASS